MPPMERKGREGRKEMLSYSATFAFDRDVLWELVRLTDRHMTRHSTQRPQNSQNKTRFLCGFSEFCVDRRG